MKQLRRFSDGGTMLHSEHDANHDRLAHYSSVWAPGSYEPNEIVKHMGGVWVTGGNTDVEPGTGLDWTLIGMDPGIGGMWLSAPSGDVVIPSAGWLPIDHYNTVDVFQQGVNPNPSNGQWLFSWRGTWAHRFEFSLTHGEVNRSRNFTARLVEVTGSVELARVRFGIARNQDTTTQSVSFRAGITPTNISSGFRIEFGEASESITAQFANLNLDLIQEHPFPTTPTATTDTG